MSEMIEQVQQLFAASIEVRILAADRLSESIVQASVKLTDCLLNNRKIFICGNGVSAANALHFSTALLDRFEIERPPLPVIPLVTDLVFATALLQEGHAEHGFSRTIQALGAEGDVLLVLTTGQQAINLVHAVDAAHERGMDVIFMSGTESGMLFNHLGPNDVALTVAGDSVAATCEMHLFVLHCFCHLIERALFGQMLG